MITTENTIKSTWNWGKGIVLAFLLFAVFILSFVYKMMHQNIDLVREDYYKEEINYTAKMDKLANAGKTKATLNYQKAAKNVEVVLGSEASAASLHFYKPDDKRLDFKIPVPSARTSNYSMAQKAPGKWKLALHWTEHGNECIKELVID